MVIKTAVSDRTLLVCLPSNS